MTEQPNSPPQPAKPLDSRREPAETRRGEARSCVLSIAWPWRDSSDATARMQLSHQGKAGSPAGPWVVSSDFPGEGSEWERDQNWASQASTERSVKSRSLGSKSLAWFCPCLPLGRAQEGYMSGHAFGEKESERCFLLTIHPFIQEETLLRRTGFALGLHVGFLVEHCWASSPSPPSLHHLLLPGPLL